jgi:hypothetical protein
MLSPLFVQSAPRLLEATASSSRTTLSAHYLQRTAQFIVSSPASASSRLIIASAETHLDLAHLSMLDLHPLFLVCVSWLELAQLVESVLLEAVECMYTCGGVSTRASLML